MTFELHSNEVASKIEDARLNPIDPNEVTPGFFTGAPTGIANGIMRGGAKVGETAMLAISAPLVLADKAFGTNMADSVFRFIDDTNAVEYWTPDPRDVGTAGRVMGGLSEIVFPLMATVGNPNLLIASTEMSEAKRLAEEGVDPATAIKVGAQQAALLGVGFMIPFFGKTFMQRAVVAGGGANVALGELSRAVSYSTLIENGYEELAKQYDPADFEAAAVDALVGFAFGTIAHVASGKQPVDVDLTTAQKDAILTANAAKHMEVDLAPGSLPPGEKLMHIRAINTAINQMARGEKVNVAEMVKNMTPKPSPITERQQAFAEAVKQQFQKIEAPGGYTIPRAGNLSPEFTAVEARFAQYLSENFDQAVRRYQKQFGNVLNTDNMRELSPDYAASDAARARLSSAVHEPASWAIKEIYARELAKAPARGQRPQVLFTAGGTGAGKSVGVEGSAAAKMSQILYDTNMNSLKSAAKKIDQALQADKQVVINYVHRDPIEALVNGALPRAKRMGRTVPLREHVNTHVGAAETLPQLIAKYAGDDRVAFNIIDNTQGKGRHKVLDIDEGLDLIKRTDYNDIEARLKSALDEELKNGKISKEIYDGTIADEQSGVRKTGSSADGRQSAQESSQQAGEGKQGRVTEPAEVQTAQRIIADDPNFKIIDDNGNEVLASEALARDEEAIIRAQKDAAGFEAAANCYAVQL